MANIFIGVRFVLLGFDPFIEAQIRSKLVSGGGVDVGEYGPSCTHVIVDNVVTDDLVCVSACNDGKTVVTRLWVEHSFDTGMPVDADMILYRPVKDLNGIPGAKSLCVCLTGYQRQDREDIMKMVGMMGAQFSKPLVANKVTHLICYKFEGEKYELAKNLKIKLVNHQWLEDCLRAWEIVPVGNYDKCGYELEMMETEAKDSDEETGEYYGSKQCDGNNVGGSPFGLTIRNPRDSKSPMPTRDVPEIFLKNFLPKDLSSGAENIIDNDRLSASSGKDTTSGEASNFHNVNGMDIGDFSCSKNGALSGDAVGGGTSIPFNNISNHTKECNESTSDSRTASLFPHSDAAKLITVRYSRRTPRRSSTSTSAESSGHLCESLRGGLEGKKINLGIGTSSLTADQTKDNGDLDSGALYLQGETTGSLPLKRALAISSNDIKSPNMENHDLKVCAPVRPGCTLGGLELKSVTASASPRRTDHTPSNNKHHGIAYVDSVENQLNGSSMMNSLSPNHISLKCGFPDLHTLTFDSTESPNNKRVTGPPLGKSSGIPMGALKSFSTAGGPGVGDFQIGRASDHPADGNTEPQKQLQDAKVSSRNIKTTVAEESKNPVHLGVVKGVNDRLTAKKVVGQKGLGSRSSTARNKKLKCVFTFDNTATPNGYTFCPMMGTKGTKGAEDQQRVTEKHNVFRPTSAADVIVGEEIEGEKTASLNDKTESLEEKDGDKLEKSLIEKVEMVKSIYSVDTSTMGSDRMPSEEGNAGAEHSSTVNIRKIDMSELSSLAAAVLENSTNDGELSSRRTRNTVSIVAGIKTYQKVKKRNEVREGKVRAEHDEGTDRKKTGMMAQEEKHSPKIPKGNTLSSVSEIQTFDEGKEREELREGQEGSELKKSFREEMTDRGKTTECVVKKNGAKRKMHPSRITKRKAVTTVNEIEMSDEGRDREEILTNIGVQKKEVPKACQTGKCTAASKTKKYVDAEKENKPIRNEVLSVNLSKHGKTSDRSNQMVREMDLTTFQDGGSCNIVKRQPVWFILSGHHLQRKEFQQVIRHLRGKFCRDSHQWSYQATHFIVPEPVRRTEKFFAAAASGRWILTTDYLTASNQARKFLPEEPYEWYRSGLSEDGTINFEAPRKWRLLRERTGHGAFYGMRVIIYGECIAPPLDTLKRVLKAGDGTILATSPPYTRFLKSGADFAIVSPGIPCIDPWVQEFLRHEIPCVLADYLVEYVCKPGYSLERYVLFNTLAWSEKSFANLLTRSEENI